MTLTKCTESEIQLRRNVLLEATRQSWCPFP